MTAWYAAEGAIVEVEIDYLAGAEVTNDEVTAILAPFEAQLP